MRLHAERRGSEPRESRHERAFTMYRLSALASGHDLG